MLSRLPTRAARWAAGLAMLWFTAAAGASGWPAKPVVIIDPYSPGGTTDFIARLLAEKLGQTFKQSFIVENRGGAGSTIGTARMVQSAPDGHVLLINNMSIAFSNALYPTLPYDTRKDIEPVALIGTTPTLMTVSNAFEGRSVQDLIERARKAPGTITYGSAGVGSTSHMAMLAFQNAAKIDLQHVPYKGVGQALTDIIGGRIDVLTNTITPMVPPAQAGSIRAIASSGKARSPAMPDVPTIAESGVPGFEYAPWFALFAPAGTPKATLDILHQEINQLLATPEVADRLVKQGVELQPVSREAFRTRYLQDIDTWTATIQRLGLSLQ